MSAHHRDITPTPPDPVPVPRLPWPGDANAVAAADTPVVLTDTPAATWPAHGWDAAYLAAHAPSPLTGVKVAPRTGSLFCAAIVGGASRCAQPSRPSSPLTRSPADSLSLFPRCADGHPGRARCCRPLEGVRSLQHEHRRLLCSQRNGTHVCFICIRLDACIRSSRKTCMFRIGMLLFSRAQRQRLARLCLLGHAGPLGPALHAPGELSDPLHTTLSS